MTAAVIITLVLAAVLITPLGVFVKYSADGGFMLSASVWHRFNIILFPRAERKKTKDVEKADKADTAGKKLSPGFSKNEWAELIKAALKAVKRFIKGICIDELFVRCTVSDGDPFDTVERYNAVNGAVGAVLPFAENTFNVRNKDIVIDLDLERGSSTLDCRVKASVRLGRLLLIAIAAGACFLKLLAENRIRRIRERKSHNGEQQTQRNDAVNNEQHQEPCGGQ